MPAPRGFCPWAGWAISARVEDLVAGDLSVRAADDAGAIVLTWSGRSNDRQPGRALDPYFAALVAEAVTKEARVEMRFGGLEHFNSATITSLIGLVQQARARGVKLSLVYDRALKWQRLSFEALRVLGKADGMLEIRPA
jgi:hypothetical protein